MQWILVWILPGRRGVVVDCLTCWPTVQRSTIVPQLLNRNDRLCQLHKERDKVYQNELHFCTCTTLLFKWINSFTTKIIKRTWFVKFITIFKTTHIIRLEFLSFDVCTFSHIFEKTISVNTWARLTISSRRIFQHHNPNTSFLFTSITLTTPKLFSSKSPWSA